MQSKPSSKIKVSIIVPCWGHPELSRQLIETMSKTVDVNFELILVDNGSGVDGGANPSWVKVVTPTHNLGFSGGNNFGLKYAKGEYILFLNNDVIINHSAWLKKLITPTERNKKLIIGYELIKDSGWTIYRNEPHQYLNGWCILAPKEFVDKIGGFDSGFGLGWFEDVWFCVQAEAMGYKLMEVRTDITHLGSKTIMDGRLRQTPMMRHAQSYFKEKMLQTFYRKENLRIVFVCPGNYKFSDISYEGKGVGGAEASLILLARELAKSGHLVDVYNDPERIGKQNGVNYLPLKQFDYTDYADCVIIFRNPVPEIKEINSPFKIFWSCDQYTTGDYTKDVFPYVDKIICISPYHMEYFKNHYFFNREKLMYFNLGVNIFDYIYETDRVDGKLIFCSVPERGLANLKKYIPLIKKRYPKVSLHITSDYRLWGAEASNEKFKEMFAGMGNVFYYGKIPRSELLIHQKTAEIMIYPGEYDENFCISAAECMAAGTVPVVSDIGALKTTVKDGGIVINGVPKDGDYEQKFVDSVCDLLENKVKLKELSRKAREISHRDYDWTLIARDWHTLIYENSRKNMINLKAHLTPLITEELSVLDLGCGNYTSGVSIQTPLIKFKSLTGVEVYKKDLDETKKKDFLTKKLDWHEEEILSYLNKHKKDRFDVIMLIDVLEHFEKKDGMKVLEAIEKMATKRILIFMPIGDHTLEANDGRVAEEKNHWQKHLSQWEVEEWRDLGYDVELLKGFHHSGKLDAAWIIKDFDNGKNFMKKCDECDQTFKSSYFLGRHKVTHGGIETPKLMEVQAKVNEVAKKMTVKLYLKKRIDISVPNLNAINANLLVIPYEQFGDVSRIITEAYGNIIEKSEMIEI